MQNIFATLEQQANLWFTQTFPDLPPQTLDYAVAGLLGLIALILLLAGIRLLRRPKTRNTSSTRTDIPRTLQRKGMQVDLLCGTEKENVAVRFVITSVRPGRIKCEIIERLDVIKIPQGKDVVCVFAPLKTRNGKVNTFTATLVESDKSGRNPDRIILSTPTDYALTARRKHVRKKVADQQFIRVKMWVEDPTTSETNYEDATPQISINAFTANGSDQAANGVINISGGGIGLSILNRLLPDTCVPDEPVVINLFMFNFKKKTFKPYWYTGTIRTMEEGRPGFTRMGVSFDAVGKADRETGKLDWFEL